MSYRRYVALELVRHAGGAMPDAAYGSSNWSGRAAEGIPLRCLHLDEGRRRS